MPQPDEYIRLDPYLYLGHESKCNVPLRSTRIILRAALSWVGDFDDMQRLIKIGRGLLPFSGVEGEDRIDCHIRAIAPAWAFRGSRPVLAIMSASQSAALARQLPSLFGHAADGPLSSRQMSVLRLACPISISCPQLTC